VGSRVVRLKHAYPVLSLGFERSLEPILRYLGGFANSSWPGATAGSSTAGSRHAPRGKGPRGVLRRGRHRLEAGRRAGVRVLLVTPPRRHDRPAHPPASPRAGLRRGALRAAVTRSASWTPRSCLAGERPRRAPDGLAAAVVGISASTAVLAPALAVATTVKEHDPDVVTLLGGCTRPEPGRVVREVRSTSRCMGKGADRGGAPRGARPPGATGPDSGIAYRDGEKPG